MKTKPESNHTYGVLDRDGCHIDVSRSVRGAKCYATRNGYLTVTVRFNMSCIAVQIWHKYTGKWQKIENENETIQLH